MFAWCLGCFWLGPFCPREVYSMYTSDPVSDVKLETLLAGTRRVYSLAGALCVPNREPCVGKAGRSN